VARTDALIIGSGIVGCSCAYFLARAGQTVTLLEMEQVAYGASGRNPGFVWLHTRNPGFALDVSLASRRLYRELVDELEESFEFRESGGLIFFATPQQGQVVREFVEARGKDGLELELLDGAEVRRLVPPIREDVLGASYCPLDAHINTPMFVKALASGARKLGAKVREGVAAEEIIFEGGRATGVRTSEGVLEADHVVVAAGVWTRGLLAEAGIDMQIGAERLQVLATQPLEERIEPVVYGPLAAKQYGLFRDLPSYDDAFFVSEYEERAGVELLALLGQRVNGQVLLGCPMDYPVELDATPTLEGLAVTAQAALEDFPGLRRSPIERTWAGLLPYTTDTAPVIGEIRPGLLVASGHVYGNSAGPMTGKLISSLVADEEPELDLGECRFERDLPPLPAPGTATRW
jgi:glycine/D-amino acid oxidase-like deaminating enzyme